MSSQQGLTRELGRTGQKRKAILDAAATVFLRNGYLGTSMDEIAALAGVSKQTVYKQFADKQHLFVEIVSSIVDETSNPVHQDVVSLRHSGDIEADLRELARRLLAGVIQPRLMQLRRLVIGEASRFPELGQVYARGLERTTTALADTFEQLTARGLLRATDPSLAAAHFGWLILSAPINHAMLLGDDTPLTPPDVQRYAEGGVRVFLAAYRTS